MTTATVKTYWAKIYVGFREGRTANSSPIMHTMEEAQAIVQTFVNDQKGKGGPCGCATLTAVRYVYGDGWEDGVEVGFINYPRFPGEPIVIKEKALQLADWLRCSLGQMRATVMFPDETIMLGGQ